MLFRQRLFILALALGAPGSSGAEVVDRIVAVVDRYAITLSEAEQARRMQQINGGEDVPLTQVVDQLIESYLIEREVKRYPGAPVTEEEVSRAVAALRESVGSEEALLEALSEQDMSMLELKHRLRRQLKISHYLDNRFRLLIYVSDEEVQEYFDNEVLAAAAAVGEPQPTLEMVEDVIRQILVEKKFNERVDAWIESLKSRARIRKHIW
jgi:parvulin-like peptidyl-prolyl isomerase